MRFVVLINGKGTLRVHREDCRDIIAEDRHSNGRYNIYGDTPDQAVLDDQRDYEEQGQGGFEYVILPCAR